MRCEENQHNGNHEGLYCLKNLMDIGFYSCRMTLSVEIITCCHSRMLLLVKFHLVGIFIYFLSLIVWWVEKVVVIFDSSLP